MAIRLTEALLEAIKTHGEETYPNECCGFLVGTMSDSENVLGALYKAENEWVDGEPGIGAGPLSGTSVKPESRRNRYLITPEQWKKGDAYARSLGFGIIGYYHSHPDHPAVPSGFDLDHSCWPGESYIIVSVQKGRATDISSYNKPDYSKFEKEEILVEG
ncbi:MAG: Mov34/MPN/PAD-1 family protein [Blastocatellia bacterium]